MHTSETSHPAEQRFCEPMITDWSVVPSLCLISLFRSSCSLLLHCLDEITLTTVTTGHGNFSIIFFRFTRSFILFLISLFRRNIWQFSNTCLNAFAFKNDRSMRDTRMVERKKKKKTDRSFPFFFFFHRRRTKEIRQTTNEGTSNKKKKVEDKKCNISDPKNRVSRLTVANGAGFIFFSFFFSRKDAVFHRLFFPLPWIREIRACHEQTSLKLAGNSLGN